MTKPDGVGQVTMIVTATDAPKIRRHSVRERPLKRSPHVRPVSGLRLNTAVVPFGEQPHDVDDAWEVDALNSLGEVPITYTLRRQHAKWWCHSGLLIPVHAATGPGYQMIGLLDVFTVGPENEVIDVFDGFPGGAPFDTATEAGVD